MSGDVLLVVACGAAKRQHPAPAAKLYCSNNFAFMLSAARSEAAETTRICGQPAGVAILSALHGLVDLDTVIAPYDLKMGQPGSCNPERVAAQLSARRPDQIIALLPAAYLRVLAAGIHIANEAGTADIELMDAFEAAPGIGYQRGVAASLLRRAGSIGRQPLSTRDRQVTTHDALLSLQRNIIGPCTPPGAACTRLGLLVQSPHPEGTP